MLPLLQLQKQPKVERQVSYEEDSHEPLNLRSPATSHRTVLSGRKLEIFQEKIRKKRIGAGEDRGRGGGQRIVLEEGGPNVLHIKVCPPSLQQTGNSRAAREIH